MLLNHDTDVLQTNLNYTSYTGNGGVVPEEKQNVTVLWTLEVYISFLNLEQSFSLHQLNPCVLAKLRLWLLMQVLFDFAEKHWSSISECFSVKDGVVLGADTRATEGMVVADKNCSKIHYISPNI